MVREKKGKFLKMFEEVCVFFQVDFSVKRIDCKELYTRGRPHVQ